MSVFTDRNESTEATDIGEVARVRLQHSAYRTIRQVSCRFEDGVLTLFGSVPTFHHKQLAQTAVVGIAGVTQVLNEIEVTSSP